MMMELIREMRLLGDRMLIGTDQRKGHRAQRRARVGFRMKTSEWMGGLTGKDHLIY